MMQPSRGTRVGSCKARFTDEKMKINEPLKIRESKNRIYSVIFSTM